MKSEDVDNFTDWFDKKLINREIYFLKDENMWFYNTKPDKPEGEQFWMKYTFNDLMEIYKNTQ